MAVFCPFCLTCLRARSLNDKNTAENSVNNSLFSFDPPKNLALLRSSLKFNTIAWYLKKKNLNRPCVGRLQRRLVNYLIKSLEKGPIMFCLKLICMLVNSAWKQEWSQVVSTWLMPHFRSYNIFCQGNSFFRLPLIGWSYIIIHNKCENFSNFLMFDLLRLVLKYVSVLAVHHCRGREQAASKLFANLVPRYIKKTPENNKVFKGAVKISCSFPKNNSFISRH